MEEKVLTIEEKLIRQVDHKRRKKRNRRLIRLVLFGSAVLLFIFYLLSDMSKVKSLTVHNNVYYTDEQILEKAHVNYQSSYLFTLRFWVNYELKKDPLIKNASLSKDLHGGFHIEIEEEKVIGYLADDHNKVMIQGIGIKNVQDIILENIPRIGAFPEEQLVLLNQAFEHVDSDVLAMISEILPHSESYNDQMARIIMNDGNRITTSFDGIELMNNYKKILPQLEGTHVCLFIDEFTNNIIKQNIDCTNAQGEQEPEQPENPENNE